MRYTALHCLPKPGRILHASHWRCEQKNLRPLESIAETQPQLQRERENFNQAVFAFAFFSRRLWTRRRYRIFTLVFLCTSKTT